MSLQSRAVTMTKQMIQIESTDPGTYENAMADWITTQLAPYPNVRLSRQEVLPGRPNLIAELTGDPSLPCTGDDLSHGYGCRRRWMDAATF